jgi:ATP-binding cassette subfamily F protein 3
LSTPLVEPSRRFPEQTTWRLTTRLDDPGWVLVMILATASDLGRQYAGDPVFQQVRFEVRAGERIGLVGPNGAGKTTLLRLLVGIDPPDYGHLHVRPGIRVSLLRQQPDFNPDTTLLEVARSGLATLLELQAELEEAAREIADAEDHADRERATRRYAELHDQLEHQDAFSIEHRVEEILQGLGFAPADYLRPAGTFSGGQQSRLMLAKLLLESPDLMLLDEPTNHLDLDTTAWLESYLARQNVAMVIVSHDRYFLDKVVTKVWELHDGQVEVYPGNYSQYWKLRQQRAKVLERQAERQAEQIADLQAYIQKYGAGQRAKQAKDREKKLARIDRVETMRSIEGPVMGFGEVERSGDIVLEARHVAKAYDRPLFQDFNLTVSRGQCVGILGPNGAGKSTLLKILIGRDQPDTGEVRLGHKVQVGYYDQDLRSLPAGTTVVRAVWPEDEPDWVEQDVRDLLARFGLTGDQAFQTIGQLSGGEKGKAALARLAATGANLLVLDEPTNHLDIWSCEALERSIREFEGTVLVVSHDRYFLNAVAERILYIAGGRAVVIEGNYDAYKRWAEEQAERNPRATLPARHDAAPRAASSAQDAKAPPAPKRKRRFPYRKTVDLEREIAQVETELAECEHTLAVPETWKDADRARSTQTRYDSLQQRLAQLYEHWEEALEFNT